MPHTPPTRQSKLPKPIQMVKPTCDHLFDYPAFALSADELQEYCVYCGELKRY